MSACNVFVTADEARIFTDGAWLRQDGTLDHIRPKVLLLPHFPAVIATQGGSDLPAVIGPQFERMFRSFDEMVAGASAFMRDPPAVLRPILAMPVFKIERVFLIGYSEAADEILGFYLQSVEEGGLPPWETARVWRAVSPPAEYGEARLHPAGGLIGPPLALDIMEEQRSFTGNIGNGTEVRAVGGFCQMTVVRREGITSRVLRRWPDRIGAMLGGCH